jgi:hypothetical protein
MPEGVLNNAAHRDGSPPVAEWLKRAAAVSNRVETLDSRAHGLEPDRLTTFGDLGRDQTSGDDHPDHGQHR